jgi:quercetin dioxygenase-like cupin family protein
MKWTRSALLFCSGIALLTVTTASDIPAQDPAVVNTHTVKVKLENDHVRVMEAVLKPGARENLHSHPGYVIYIIDGGRFRNHTADGQVSEFDVEAGMTMYSEPATHWAENIGKTTIRLVVVELKGKV